MHRILIVEDDTVIAQAMAKYIKAWGEEVRCVQDFSNVLGEFLSYDPHLVLLDVYLPFFNGYHWCQEMRKVSKVPIIFISSTSNDMNIVMAMNMGGDDFIAKPFDLNVLTAKIQAMLRRSYDFFGQTQVLEHRGLLLNLNDFSLNYGTSRLELTRNDFKILQILMEQRGKVVSREAIMTRLWESDSFVDENTLTVNMARLRKKLESIGIADFITTKKGVGYVVL